MRKTCLAALALTLALPARAEEGDLRFQLVLHGRYTNPQNLPRPLVLYDVGQRAFDLDRYLRTAGEDSYASGFAALGVEGRHRWFRWGLAADTGEVRSRAFPRVAEVCAVRLEVSPSRLGVCPAGRTADFLLEETRPGAAQVTSNGRPFGEEGRDTLLLREAWVGASFGRNDFALVKAGRKRFTVADGFVYDDYGTGVEASFDLGALGPSFDLGAAVFYPTRGLPEDAASVMVALRADYLPSLFERAGLFFAYFRDRTNSVAELFRSTASEPLVTALRGLGPGDAGYGAGELLLAALQEVPLESRGWLSWAGTSGSLAVRGARLDWTGALGFGHTAIRGVRREGEGSIFGQLAHLRLTAHATRELELGGFFLFLSGDAPPQTKAERGQRGDYGGFLGVAPFVTATNIFFQGGVAESFAARQTAAPGVDGRGVIAPGLTASWDPLRGVGVDARAAYLFSPRVGPFGGQVYGPELDLEVTWSPLSWLTFAAEGDVLFPGDFFAGRAPITKVVLGVDVVAM